MIVVDASAFTEMLTFSESHGQAARAILGADHEWTAPDHWMAEVFSAIRGLVLGGHLSEEVAVTALARLPRLAVDRVRLDGLLPMMWRMRDAISGYDAAYVALARQRNITLVSADARLARAATVHCRVELVE